jgi:ribonuclease BN (tRNA processing enzyme)
VIAPADDVIEVSLLGGGNGYGECIVVHLGYGQWMIVDCVTHPKSKSILPLEYLSSLGINASERVKTIVATHWHEDHIRGLSKVIEQCQNADFYCATPLETKEFLIFTAAEKQALLNATRSRTTKEIISIFEKTSPKFAFQDRCLYFDKSNHIEVNALSPSDNSTKKFLEELRTYTTKLISNNSQKIPSSHPNHASVVLSVEIGNEQILLGADLEITTQPQTGWTAVINAQKAPSNASVFKIPHHGSENGYLPEIWSQLVSTHPIAILTPYRKGGYFLPQEIGVHTILNHTDKAFITSTPTPNMKNKKRPGGKARKMIKSLGLDIKEIPFRYGHIQLRKKIGSDNDWTVQLIGSAIPLVNVLEEM